mmetsp:Transcript_11241/g.69427  ORF Transcript_11241/g.69427 Transcript_11241/m.69427 type:complete len:261 (-) Transcript_11241:1596-2378(-)
MFSSGSSSSTGSLPKLDTSSMLSSCGVFGVFPWWSGGVAFTTKEGCLHTFSSTSNRFILGVLRGAGDLVLKELRRVGWADGAPSDASDVLEISMACCQEEERFSGRSFPSMFSFPSGFVRSILIFSIGASTSVSLSESSHRFLPCLFPRSTNARAPVPLVSCVSISSSFCMDSIVALWSWNGASASQSVSLVASVPIRAVQIASNATPPFQIDAIPKSDTSCGSRRYASTSSSMLTSPLSTDGGVIPRFSTCPFLSRGFS